MWITRPPGLRSLSAEQVADLEARLDASAGERERLEQRTAQLEAEVGYCPPPLLASFAAEANGPLPATAARLATCSWAARLAPAEAEGAAAGCPALASRLSSLVRWRANPTCWHLPRLAPCRLLPSAQRPPRSGSSWPPAPLRWPPSWRPRSRRPRARGLAWRRSWRRPPWSASACRTGQTSWRMRCAACRNAPLVAATVSVVLDAALWGGRAGRRAAAWQ